MSRVTVTVTRGPFTITTDPHRIDVDAVHRFLTASYWAEGIPKDVVARSIANSLCFGVLHGNRQVGFARAITDRATYAYLGDVYVLEEYRGQGLGTWLIATIMDHPDLQGLRRMSLVTRDAHSLYRRHGFQMLAHPERYMEIARPEVYRRP